MPRTLTYIVCLMLLIAGSQRSIAQDSASVKVSINKNQILIGEPIRLSIDVKSPMVSGNILPQFDSLPHFEMIEKANRDSVISAHGASYHLEWKITSFDSGTRIIPAFTVALGNRIYKTDSLAVEVSYGATDTSKDYHDIKGIVDLENPNVKYIPWMVGAITFLALLLFAWFIRHPFAIEKIAGTPALPSVSPLEEAMASLQQVKKILEDDPSAVKKYYSGMNDTFRIFLNRRLGLNTMEKTSEELILAMSNLNLEREHFSELATALRMGDFVKFAKYVPGPYENGQNLELIRSSIVFINETGK